MAALEHYLTLGQSLPDGSQGTPSLSTASEVANAFIVDLDGRTLNALKSSVTQRPYLSMGYRIAEGTPAQTFGFSTHALSGRTIAQLSKGGSSGRYEQSIATVIAAHGVQPSHEVPGINWFQGEADQTYETPRTAYRASFEQLYADYAADIAAATSQAAVPLWVINQTATWAYYGTPASIGLEQLDIARAMPGVYLVGGQYQLPYAPDGLHMNNIGYYKIGELIGRAFNAVNAGAGWEAFAPVEIVAIPLGIRVTYAAPVPPLAFDTTVIPRQEHMGFSLSDTTAVITGVQVTGPSTITITTDQNITEVTAKLGYGVSAHNGGSGLGNLRDSETAVSVYDGAPLPNWAAHSLDPIVPLPPKPPHIFRVTQMNYVGPSGLMPLTIVPAAD